MTRVVILICCVAFHVRFVESSRSNSWSNQSAAVNDTSISNTSLDRGSWNVDIAPTEEQLNTVSNDWLFHVRTTSCTGASFDNTTDSLLSRMILPFLFLGSICAIALTAYPKAQSLPEAQKLLTDSGVYDTFHASLNDQRQSDQRQEDANAQTLPEPKARLWHLDFARIAAVICVIGEHSGGTNYSRRNVSFALWWVLPYLYMTSGIGCTMSTKSTAGYVARLACVFVVGVSANWFADVVNHRDWQGDFANTIFQMFFIVMLVAMAVVTEPLKNALQRRRDHAHAKATKTTLVAATVWGLITMVGLWNFVRSSSGLNGNFVNPWLQYYSPVLKHIPIISVQCFGTLFLGIYGTIVSKPENTGFIGWVLLAYIYVPVVMIPWNEGSFFHLMCLYIFAMVTTVFPLTGSGTISKSVRAYWPFLVISLMFMSMPDMWGRCDVHPAYTTFERLRSNCGEFILVVCFVTNSFTPSDPHKVTVWMGWWSLYAYCFHVMNFRLLGSPYGAVVSYSSMLVFYVGNLCLGANSSKKQEDATICSHHKPSCSNKDELTYYIDKGMSPA